MDKIIAYDLGTGGIKASLFDVEGRSIANTFVQYDTKYITSKFYEQRPDDWVDGIIKTTKLLLKSENAAEDVVGLSISGQSLGVVPVDKNRRLLREYTPIWSDTRAKEQADRFFRQVDYEKWYMTTGNGFPPACYSIFKIMWYAENEPEMLKKAEKIIGSKDYCNLFLTGRTFTDHSYASGSGVYSLEERKYVEEYISASGLTKVLFPEIIEAHEVVGNLTKQAARALGLTTSVKVVCGGVDNSCMALGAKGIKDGRTYTSLGSSSWISAIGKKPITDFKYKPFVFAHVIPDMYVSATSIFAAGSSLRWVRENICTDIFENEKSGKISDAYIEMNNLAAKSPIGANGLIFNPSLAGGSMQEESQNICGGFVGLNLSHSRNDIVRSTMEGITYNLRYVLDILRTYQDGINEMLIVGGGSKSEFWMQMFADVFKMNITKTNIDQDCASLGAAALCAVGLGYWKDYSRIDSIHKLLQRYEPELRRSREYDKMYMISRDIAHFMAISGDVLSKIK